ncbi:hypothetical protein [Halomarina rubra]|uniref:Uncharacterized protein n=1 Tax=Halomarina rubra TaxID=2071873 RepID=A0ABD6ASB6_9EURY|nr:hypothetical protein [Halomarina rubra]
MSLRRTSLRLTFALVLVTSVVAAGLGAGVAAAEVDDRYLTEFAVENTTANASGDAVEYTYDNATDTATLNASGDDVVYRVSVKVDERVYETTNAPVSLLRAANVTAAETPALGPEADTDVVDVQYADGTVTVTNASAAQEVVTLAVDSTQVAPGLDASAVCADTADDIVRFNVSNDNAEAASVDYFVEETGADGTLNLSANGSETLEFKTTARGDATLELYADGMVVETVDASETTETCDLDERFNILNAYQFDLVGGEPIENIGDNETAFYSDQNRLVQATSVTDDGDVTATYQTPVSGNATATVDNSTVTYDAIEYDVRNDTATVTVSLDENASTNTTVSLAGYQLPDDTETYDRSLAGEQMFKDAQTVTLSPGETVTLEIVVEA